MVHYVVVYWLRLEYERDDRDAHYAVVYWLPFIGSEFEGKNR